MKPQFSLPTLPPQTNLETVPVLRALAVARANLGELKGTVKSLPNPGILTDSLFLQEALASSEIEDIVTTHDEAFQGSLFDNVGSVEAKEVIFGYPYVQLNSINAEFQCFRKAD